MKVAVIDYGMGNLHSVCKAFEHVGASPDIIKEPTSDIDRYSHLVLPGVGSLGDCMEGLEKCGFVEFIHDWINADRPFLGVCLGLQALFEHSEENDAKGLGVFKGEVIRFQLSHEFKIPHIGWNEVQYRGISGPMGELAPKGSQFYFDHSYHVVPRDPDLIWGSTHHGHEFVSAISKGNCFAVQFHPEKSQSIGLQIYKNFVNIDPSIVR
jgi:glutamine amidotransferase